MISRSTLQANPVTFPTRLREARDARGRQAGPSELHEELLVLSTLLDDERDLVAVRLNNRHTVFSSHVLVALHLRDLLDDGGW